MNQFKNFIQFIPLSANEDNFLDNFFCFVFETDAHTWRYLFDNKNMK